MIGILYVRGHKEPEKSIVTVEEEPEPVADPHAGQARSLLTGEWIDASLVRNRPIAIMMEDTKARFRCTDSTLPAWSMRPRWRAVLPVWSPSWKITAI